MRPCVPAGLLVLHNREHDKTRKMATTDLGHAPVALNKNPWHPKAHRGECVTWVRPRDCNTRGTGGNHRAVQASKQANKQTGKQDNNNYYYTRAEETNTSSTSKGGSVANARRQKGSWSDSISYIRMSSPRVQRLTNNTPCWANGTRAGFRRMDFCLVQIPIAVLETLGLGACRKRLSYYCVASYRARRSRSLSPVRRRAGGG